MLTTPTAPNLPEDIQKQLTDANNAITLATAEVIRLRDLRVSEETTIVELNKQIVYANEQLNTVNANLAYSEEELKKNTDTIASQTSEIALQREEKTTLANSLTERENAWIEQEKHLADIAVQLNFETSTLKARLMAVENRETEVTERENKIKEFVATL